MSVRLSDSWQPRAAWCLAAFLVLACLGPASAFAATTGESGGAITFNAAPGETNQLSLKQSGTNLQIVDTGGLVETAATGCSLATTTTANDTVVCPDSIVTTLTVNLGDHDDTLTATSGLTAHLASLTVEGGAGNDFIDGTATSITKTLSYANSPSGVTVDLAAGFSSGGEGGDTLVGFANVTGSSSADTIVGDENVNSLSGNGGADTLVGAGASDTLSGGTGNDTISYSAVGGTSYGGSASPIDLNFITNTATGEGSDTFSSIEVGIGSPSADTLHPGSSGNDLHGGAGNDTFYDGPGDDIYDGGPGNDTIDYSASTAGVTASLLSGSASGSGSGGDSIALSTVENLTGTSHLDNLTGNASANTILGGDGNDSISNGGGGADALEGDAGLNTVDFSSDSAVTANLATSTASSANGSDSISGFQNIVGSPTADNLTGDSASNNINGAGGDDTIAGRGEDDTLSGGGGVDTVSYALSSTPVVVDLASGTATGEGADLLSGFSNATGSNYADTLIGDGQANTLSGGGGDDTIEAADASADTVNCGTGTDSETSDGLDTVNADCEIVNGVPRSGGSAPPQVVPPVTPPVAPTVQFTKKPKSTVTTTKSKVAVTFAFAASLQGATYQCKLDAGKFKACHSPTKLTLKAGKHTFAVKAVSTAGLVSPVVSVKFKVRRTR